MADMHRPGRIGRDVFDVDRRCRGRCRSRRSRAPSRTALRSASIQAAGLEREIDESRAGDVDLGDQLVGAKLFGDRFGEFARLLAGILGQHHGGVGRHVAMRRIARRLDRDARLIDAGRQYARGDQRVVRARERDRAFRRRCSAAAMDAMSGVRVDVRARLTQFRGRVKEPARVRRARSGRSCRR